MAVKTLEWLEPMTTTHTGREKMMRFCQYFSAFMVPTLQKQGVFYEDAANRFALLKANMSLTRKVMRFGGEISIILRMIRRFKENQTNPVKMMFF